MSQFLGFSPTDKPFYYFVSYNSEDKDRISAIAKSMSYSGIDLWYDYGIKYGDGWEETITDRISKSQGIILFFTKGILQKKDSFVLKEYKIAEFLKKEIYIILLDEIKNEDVPVEKISWWIDLRNKQNIELHSNEDVIDFVPRLGKLLGIETFENKMNKMIEDYNSLYFEGKYDEASNLLNAYLKNFTLKGKAQIVNNLINKGFLGFKTFQIKHFDDIFNESSSKSNLYISQKIDGDFDEGVEIKIDNDVYSAKSHTVFHRGVRGDACIIRIYKNGEQIYVVGGLVEESGLELYYDMTDKILYLSYTSDKEPSIEEGPYDESKVIRDSSVLTIELSGELPVCTDFRFINL